MLLALAVLILRPAQAAGKTVPPASKPVVSGYIFTDDASESVMLLRDSLAGALGYHPAIRWKAPDVQLPPPNIAAVDEAAARVAKAQDLGKEGEIAQGLEELRAALKLLDDNIYTLCTATPKAIGKYINVLRRLSVFLFFSEDREGAENVLRRLFALNPGLEFKKFTKEIKPLFMKIQKEQADKGMTTLEVVTSPPGARVYYNFEQEGPAPVKVEEVPAGEAILLAVLPGYEPRVERVTVTPPAEGTVPVTIALQPTALMQKIIPLRSEMDAETATPPILEAASALAADILVVLRLESKGPREVAVHAAVFDSRSKVRLSARVQTLDPAAVKPEQVRAFVASLFDGVRLDGLTGPVKAPAAGKKSSGFWPELWTSVGNLPQKKYFWPVVGSAAGAILVGAVVTALLLQGENVDEYRRTTGSKVVLGF